MIKKIRIQKIFFSWRKCILKKQKNLRFLQKSKNPLVNFEILSKILKSFSKKKYSEIFRKISWIMFFKIKFLHTKIIFFVRIFFYHQSLLIRFPTHLARASGTHLRHSIFDLLTVQNYLQKPPTLQAKNWNHGPQSNGIIHIGG